MKNVGKASISHDHLQRFMLDFLRKLLVNYVRLPEKNNELISQINDPRPTFPEAHLIGSLSNSDGNGNENVTQKYIFISFVLLRDYFNSRNFYKNGELPRNQIGRSGVQVKKANEKFTVVCSRSPQNLKCGHFYLPKCKTHVRRIVFAH